MEKWSTYQALESITHVCSILPPPLTWAWTCNLWVYGAALQPSEQLSQATFLDSSEPRSSSETLRKHGSVYICPLHEILLGLAISLRSFLPMIWPWSLTSFTTVLLPLFLFLNQNCYAHYECFELHLNCQVEICCCSMLE